MEEELIQIQRDFEGEVTALLFLDIEQTNAKKLIQWNAIEHENGKWNKYQRGSALKCIHWWCDTTITKNLGIHKDDTCPTCEKEAESPGHVLRCKNAEMKKF